MPSQKSAFAMGGARGVSENKVEPGQMPASIERLAYPNGNTTHTTPMGDYVDDYNRPRVLQWVKDHAQQTIGNENESVVKNGLAGRRSLDTNTQTGTPKVKEVRNLYNTSSDLDHHRPTAVASTPISEKRQRTKWCIPELPKSPPGKESPRYPWSEKSDQDGSACAKDGTLDFTCNNMELRPVIDGQADAGKAPWSETTESEIGKGHLDGETGIVDSYDSETSFHGALVRAQLSCGAVKPRTGDMQPMVKLVTKARNDKMKSVEIAATATPPTSQQEAVHSTESSIKYPASTGTTKSRIARKSSIPRRSNRLSSMSSSLDSVGSSAKGPETSFGYRKLQEVRKPAESPVKPQAKAPVEKKSLPTKSDNRKGTAKLSAQKTNEAVARPGEFDLFCINLRRV